MQAVASIGHDLRVDDPGEAAPSEVGPMPSAASLAQLDGGPWRLSMGLRRLDPTRWLEVDGDRASDLRAKAALLATAHSTVLATLERSVPASEELAALVIDHLDAAHPGCISVDGRTVTDVATGFQVDRDSMHPIEAASRLVQDDLCILEHDGRTAEWRLSAASVCFPSRWRLADKLGATLREIHEPVPGFDAELSSPSTRFFDRLDVDRPAWRTNWTIIDSPVLHQPSPARPMASPVIASQLGRSMFLRVERQTLRRLAVCGAIVFTIRTYLTSLAQLVSDRPEAAGALAATLRTVPDDVAAYKGWSGLVTPLIEWLDAHDGTAS